MGARFLFIGTLPLCLVSGIDCAQAQTASGDSEVLPAIEVNCPNDSQPDQRPASTRSTHLEPPGTVRRVFVYPTAPTPIGRHGNRCRQGAGKRQRGRCGADRAHRLAEHRGRAAATRAGPHHQRHDRQSISAGHPVSRLCRVSGRRHSPGTGGLPERDAHQRSVRRHRQLGLDPDGRDQVGHRRDQQSRVRPQCAGRGGQRADEEWLQLSGRRNQHDGRLVRARPEFGAVGQADRQFRRLWRARRIARQRISQFFGIGRSAASTAMSATGPTAANSISTWASPTTISARRRRCRSNCCRTIGARPTPRRRPQTTGLAMSI